MVKRPGSADPAELGRGPLTRWLPVLWQAPAATPDLPPYTFDTTTTPRQFLLRVMFSIKRLSIPAAVLFIVFQIGESAVPVVMGAAIDRALATGDRGELLLWLLVLALLFLTKALAVRFGWQLNEHATQLVRHRLRSTLSRTVLHPADTSGRRPDGGVVSIMTNDVTRLGTSVGLAVLPVAEVAAIIFIAVSLLLIHWPLGIVVLVAAPAVVWLMGAMSGQYATSSRAYQTLLARTVGKAADLVAGYRVIKGVRAEEEATARYRAASQEALEGAKRNAGWLGRYTAGSGTVSGVFVAAVTALASWFALDGQLSVGELIAAAGLAQALIPQMAMVTGNAVPAWAAANASGGRVLDALREAGRATASVDRVPERTPKELPALPTVELVIAGHDPIRIEPGELVGMAANDVTGARVVEALLNPYVEVAGVQVQIGGTPGGLVDHDAYRSRVVVAPHTPMLFSGTVADNLDLSAASGELRTAALRAAMCEDFAADDGDRVVGEGGNRLSGGQRQRVALARALATDAPVLVLHDPTTAVDSVTEAMIASRLRELRQGRSTLLITASPAPLGVCDRVVDLRPSTAPLDPADSDQTEVSAS